MQLYIQNINELENVDDLINNLSEYRKNSFYKFRQPQDKLRSLAADYLIKKHVSTNNVLKNEYGKPYIKNMQYFNLSHSGDYTILSVNNTSIGCDIEAIKEIDTKEISKRAFHKKEIEQLEAVNYDLKTFYKIWTLKESYLKMLGTGLSIDMKSFYVDLKTLEIEKHTKLELFENLNDYIIAISFKYF